MTIIILAKFLMLCPETKISGSWGPPVVSWLLHNMFYIRRIQIVGIISGYSMILPLPNYLGLVYFQFRFTFWGLLTTALISFSHSFSCNIQSYWILIIIVLSYVSWYSFQKNDRGRRETCLQNIWCEKRQWHGQISG